MNGINSVLVDNSFCIRLLKIDDELHQNAVDYFEYFLENGIELYLSTIVVSEYAVGDDPNNLLSLSVFKLLEFDYSDAKFSGSFLATLKELGRFGEFGIRKVVINDIKLFAQIHNRKIDGYITNDIKSFNKMVEPLSKRHNLKFNFIDLSIPLHEKLGKLDL